MVQHRRALSLTGIDLRNILDLEYRFRELAQLLCLELVPIRLP